MTALKRTKEGDGAVLSSGLAVDEEYCEAVFCGEVEVNNEDIRLLSSSSSNQRCLRALVLSTMEPRIEIRAGEA